MKSLFVGGIFDVYVGQANPLDGALHKAMNPDGDYLNGGNISVLLSELERMQDYQRVYWFARTPTNEGLVKQVKRRNGNVLLVNGIENDSMSFAELMQYGLDTRSNLIVEKTDKGARILDPLANMYLDFNKDMNLVGRVLNKRLSELENYTRERSSEVTGERAVPDDKEFFEAIREHAGRFHEFVHENIKEEGRFLGNASFRCESGFPSFRGEGVVYVSRRNVDKMGISAADFVPVMNELPLRYYGKQKPSVDAPIQVRLYSYYPNVKYMLHGHVYLDDAPFTEKIVPCGSLEEVEEIVRLHPNRNESNFRVNLLGHGSIVFANNVNELKKTKYVGRNMPEMHYNYLDGGKNGK